MILLGLKVDENPLIIELMRSPDKKREEDSLYQEIYDDMYFKTKDREKISKIMDYFVKNCDEHISPQSLFRFKGTDYLTLIKDYEKNSDFDEVLDRVAEILDISLSDKDRKYIRGVDISYPETWEVIILRNDKK